MIFPCLREKKVEKHKKNRIKPNKKLDKDGERKKKKGAGKENYFDKTNMKSFLVKTEAWKNGGNTKINLYKSYDFMNEKERKKERER